MPKKLKLNSAMKTIRPSRSNTKKKKRCPFHHRGLECKSRKQDIPWVTGKLGLRVQNEAGQRLTILPRVRTNHSKYPLPTMQETTLHMDITRWSILKWDWLYSLQSKRSSIQSAKTTSGPDCGSDHELLIAKFRLKLKKVGKTCRPFRYNLNQVPYDYTVMAQHYVWL